METVLVAYLDGRSGETDLVYEIWMNDNQERRFDFGFDATEGLAVTENFRSSDESVFRVYPNGTIVAMGDGEATLTYTVTGGGKTSSATAKVVVNGGIIPMDPASLELAVGESSAIAPVMPEGVIARDIHFYPSMDGVVEISDTGLVTGKGAGSVKVFCEIETIHDRTYIAECVVTVTDGGFDLDKTSLTLYGGQVMPVSFVNNTGKAIIDAQWESTNADAVYAEIITDENDMPVSLIIGARHGDWAYPSHDTVTITVTFEDETTASVVCFVTGDAPIVSLEGVWGNYELNPGATFRFQHYIRYADGYSEDNVEVSFRSTNKRIVTVDENGVMTASSENTGIAQVLIQCMVDGMIVAQDSSYVVVGCPIPEIMETDWIRFTEDSIFEAVPRGDDERWIECRVEISDSFLWSFYEEVFYEISDPDDAIELHSDGFAQILGEGTAVVGVKLVPHNPDITEYREVTDEMTIVVGKPELEYTVSRAVQVTGEDGSIFYEQQTVEPEMDEEGRLMMQVGDVIDVTVTGIPEEIGFRHWNWGYNNNGSVLHSASKAERSLRLYAREAGESGIFFNARLDGDAWLDMSLQVSVAEAEDEFHLWQSAMELAVGETVEIHPMFDCDYGRSYFVSSNEGVVRPVEDEFCLLTAVGTGSAVVTAYCMIGEDENGEPIYVTATCIITVEESVFGLEHFEPNEIMLVGHSYDPSVSMFSNGWNDPRLSFSFSEEGIIEMDYEEWRLRAVGAGTVEVTVTAEKNGVTDTLSTQITVVDTGVGFIGNNFLNLRPGAAGTFSLYNATGKDVESVAWTVSQSAVASVEGDGMSAEVYASMVNENVHATVTARVVFTDSTSQTVSAIVSIISDDEVDFDIHIHNGYEELYVTETYNIDWSHNGWYPDTVSFLSSNPEIASVSAAGLVTAKNPGEATITLVARNGNIERTSRATVVVRNFKVELNPSDLYLHEGEAAYLVPNVTHIEDGYWINDEKTGFWSMDDSVATVDHMGLVTARGAGSTTIGYETRTFYDDHRFIAYATVVVDGQHSDVLSLNETYVELSARESFQLGVVSNDESRVIDTVEWVSSDENWLQVNENGLINAHQWDIEEPRTVSVSANVTFEDGTQETAVCTVVLKPSEVSVYGTRNFYEITVGQKQLFEYTVSLPDPDMKHAVRFESDDESIAAVNEQTGMVKGVSEGRTLVHMIITELIEREDEPGTYTEGRQLFSGASWFYVDTPIPVPYEGCIEADYDHYYLRPDHGVHVNVRDEDGIGVFHELRFASDDENIVSFGGNWMQAHNEGATTIRMWFEGYEQYAVTARVTVGEPYLSYHGVTEWDEYNNPHVTIGDVLTVKIENMPPFGDMSDEQIAPNFIDINVGENMLREIGRNDAENSFTFLALDNGFVDGSIMVNLNDNRNYWMWLGVGIDDRDDAYTMEELALVMAEGETVYLWPRGDWQEDWTEVVSVASDNEDVLTATAQGDCLVLKGKAQGSANVTAEYTLANGENITTSTSVVVGPYYWNVNLDNIPDTMELGERYYPWPNMDHGTYYAPEYDWEISDENILALEDNDDGLWLVPHEPGTVTLTMDFVMEDIDTGETEHKSVSKQIRVVEPAYQYISFETNETEVRPGESFFVPLHINTDFELLNVQYTSEDPGLVEVRNMLDDPSYPEQFPDYRDGEAVIITGIKANNSTRIFARADFRLPDDTPDNLEDNEYKSYYAAMRVYPIGDEAVELEVFGLDGYGYNVDVTNEYWGEDGGETIGWLNYETNAAVYGNGQDTLVLDWSIDDTNIANIYDENGNVLLEGYGQPQNGVRIIGVNPGQTVLRLRAAIENQAGEVIREQHNEYWVNVHEPRLEVRFDQPNYFDENGTPVFELRGTDNRSHAGWTVNADRAMHPLTERVWVDDHSIATVSSNGELVSVAPGETRVRVRVSTANGHGAETEARVIVFGNDNDTGRVDMGIYDSWTTIAAGTSANIPHYLYENGYTVNHEQWRTSDESVATVSKDGTVYGVAPGYACITWHVNTEYGWHEAQSIVEVTGDAEGFRLDRELLTMYRGSRDRLLIVCDEGYEAVEGTITFESSDPEVLKVDNEGNLHATDWDHAKDYYVTVTARADNAAGETMTATALVMVPQQKLRIAGRQFGDGRWEAVDLFDWEHPLTIREQYITSDPEMNVDVEVTVDMTHDYDEHGYIIRTYPVIVWDEECGGYIGVNPGETTMHYTVTADSGETYTADMKVFVAQDRSPDELKLREGYEYIITSLGDNNRFINEAIDWPEYRGCELRYEVIEQQIHGDYAGDVIHVNPYDDRIHTGNPGVATVRAYCPYDESLELEVKVLVFSPEDNLVMRVDDPADPSAVYTGEDVKLGLRSKDGSAPVWEELGIEVETRAENAFGLDSYKSSEDGMSFTSYFWGEGDDWWHNVGVRFPDGYTWHTNYHYYLFTDNFFRVRMNSFPQNEEFVGNPGERMDGEIGWDSSIHEDYHVFWESADASIATVDENGVVVLSRDKVNVGTEITGIAMRWIGEGERDFSSMEGWQEIARDSFPVRIIPVAPPNFEINTQGIQTVVVGEKLNMWIGCRDEKTNAPHHEFVSGDEEILAPHMSEEGWQYYGEFIAKKPGTVTVTAYAWTGYTEDNHQASEADKNATLRTDTITIHVVAAEPVIWLEGVDMRPDETHTVHLRYDQNGAERTIQSVNWMFADGENPIAVMTPGENAEMGEYWVTLTEGVADRSDLLFANITFTDGTVHETSCNVFVRPDWAVNVWSWHDDTYLSSDGVLGRDPVSASVWVNFDTNAALSDHENPGTDYAEITWELAGQYDMEGNETDQEIVTLVSTEGEGLWNNGVPVKANGIDGSAVLHATVVICNSAGEELSRCEEWIPVRVQGSSFSLWFDDEDGWYDIWIEDHYKLIRWSTHEENVTQNRRVIFWSDDPSVVTTDIHGNVQLISLGETDIHVQVVFGEGDSAQVYQADAHVKVHDHNGNTQPVELSIDRSQVTLGVDEQTQLNAYVNDNGVIILNQYWYSNNEDVANITNEGILYGVKPGVAMVKYCVDTDYGHEEAICIVEVTGEREAFRLGDGVLTMFTEQTREIEIINENGLELSNVELHVSNEEAMHAELVDGEDGRQYVRVYAEQWGSGMDKYELITVTADTQEGAVSANCQIIIPMQKLRIIGEQFENGGWWAMGAGERHPVELKWIVSEPSLVDRVRGEMISDNPEIAYLDAATGEIVGVAQGETVIRYNVWIENDDGTKGETRSGEYTVFVNMDRMPEDVVARYNPHIAFLDWGEAYMALDYLPDMTHTYTQFVSHNPEILTFDDEYDAYKMTLHGEGMARVEVMFPENDRLNFDAYVLVIDPNNVAVRRVDVDIEAGESPYQIGTLERANIGFTDAGGGQVIWERYGIPVEYVFDEYDQDYVNIEVDENNQIFLNTYYTHTDSSIAHRFGVRFKEGQTIHKYYEYWINPEKLFAFAYLEDKQRRDLTGVVGEYRESSFGLCTNYDGQYAIRYETGNDQVAVIDENGDITLVGEGETELHAIASNWIDESDGGEEALGHWEDVYAGGEPVRASIPVRVLAPYAPVFRIAAEYDRRMLNVGDMVQLYIDVEDDPSTYVPMHTYESRDTDILVPHLDENGNQIYGQFVAVAPGRVYVDAYAWNAYDENGEPMNVSHSSMEFIVVGNEFAE